MSDFRGRAAVATLACWAGLAAGACVKNESADEFSDGGSSPGASGLRADAGRRADAGHSGDAGGAGTPSSSSSSSGGSPHPDGGAARDGGSVNLVDAGGWTPGPASACSVWQDCPPHFGDLNSGFECAAGQCVCDPSGAFAATCLGWGRTWVAAECICPLDTAGPPGTDPDPDPADDVWCWWAWHSDGCDPDRWVDTSHYERECETINGRTECRDVWVDSGYWESGNCSGGRWIKRCSDGTEIWY